MSGRMSEWPEASFEVLKDCIDESKNSLDL